MLFEKISKHHQKNLMMATIICLIAVIVTLLILNVFFGLVVYYFDQTQEILWNEYTVVFLSFVCLVMFSAVVYDIYVFRKGGHSLAKQMNARHLKISECTPEEISAVELTEKLAKSFNIASPSVYVLPDEIGVNALTAGKHSEDTVIILTWGALQNLDELELYGLLSYAFNQILTGEMKQNIRLKILFSALTSFNQLGSKIARRGFKPYGRKKPHKFETVLVALGGIIWLMGSLGLLISRFIKFISLSGRTFKNDYHTHELIANDTNLQTLLRIYVYHAGSQIHSAYSESIAHMCFANSLSPQSWLNIHPKIERRIYSLNPSVLQELQLKNLHKLQNQTFFNLFRPFMETAIEAQAVWIPPYPLPYLRQSPLQYVSKDEIKPLNPEFRKKTKRPELLIRALQTSTGAREVLVAILTIRQFREFIPKETLVSRAIIDTLLTIDDRLYIQIFYDACDNLNQMPLSTSRQFLTKLATIIQADQYIGLLDSLLIEKVRCHLNLLPAHMPVAFDDAIDDIVDLIDALLHVQMLNEDEKKQIRDQILTNLSQVNIEPKKIKPIHLNQMLHRLSGLLLRDRLKVLRIAEKCLWTDHIITQEELDVLQLLYWRLGFKSEGVIEQVLKKNKRVIV